MNVSCWQGLIPVSSVDNRFEAPYHGSGSTIDVCLSNSEDTSSLFPKQCRDNGCQIGSIASFSHASKATRLSNLIVSKRTRSGCKPRFWRLKPQWRLTLLSDLSMIRFQSQALFWIAFLLFPFFYVLSFLFFLLRVAYIPILFIIWSLFSLTVKPVYFNVFITFLR